MLRTETIMLAEIHFLRLEALARSQEVSRPTGSFRIARRRPSHLSRLAVVISPPRSRSAHGDLAIFYLALSHARPPDLKWPPFRPDTRHSSEGMGWIKPAPRLAGLPLEH